MKPNPKKSLSRRQAIKGAAGVGVAALAASVYGRIAPPARRPNIVFLLADDLRFDGVGYVNKDVITPHLDQLAGEGVRFHNMFVTTAICCTSRASIFTGAYARRHGVWDFTTNLPSQLLRNSYPALLKAAGYRTGFFGKYGVGDYKVGDAMGDGIGPMPHVPVENAACFDEIEDFDRYYAPGDTERAHHNNDAIAERAEKFIHGSSTAQPFCLSLSFKAPHVSEPIDLLMGPYTAEPDMLELYSKKIFTEGPVVIDTVGIDKAGGWDIYTQPPAARHAAAFNSLPPYLRHSENRRRWIERFSNPWLWQDSMRKYYALISGVDRAIGRIISALKETGCWDNTVVIFTGDNGVFLGDYGLADKQYGYEASIRVPLVIRPLQKPVLQDVSATTLNIDLASTILAFAGIPAPATMAGRDLSPLWTNARSRQPWRSDFLYEHYLAGLHNPSASWERLIPSSEGVRNERYTYLRYPRQAGDNEQLFDRIADADELNNIIHSVPPEIVESLRRRTDALIADNG